MITSNIYDLLECFFSNGFTVESLSKATNVPIELINRCYKREELSQEDYYSLVYVLEFLTQLYLCDITDSTYLQDKVIAMHEYFMVPLSAIAKYLNLSEEELDIFLNKPECYRDGYNLSIKLLHLFTSLVRDKRL